MQFIFMDNKKIAFYPYNQNGGYFKDAINFLNLEVL